MPSDAPVPWTFRLVVMVATAIAVASSNGRVPVPDDAHATVRVARIQETPRSFRQTVHAQVAERHRRVPYSRSGPDTWDALSDADADPTLPGNILTLYGNASFPRASAGNENWEREHIWPRSFGLSDDDRCDMTFTDLHHLRPVEPDLNQSRGNDYFDWCRRRDCSPKPLRDGSGRANRTWGDIWEVWDGRRGDVARALLYMDVRYEGGSSGTGRCAEPDLRLTDDRSLIVSRDYPTDVAYMGRALGARRVAYQRIHPTNSSGGGTT